MGESSGKSDPGERWAAARGGDVDGAFLLGRRALVTGGGDTRLENGRVGSACTCTSVAGPVLALLRRAVCDCCRLERCGWCPLATADAPLNPRPAGLRPAPPCVCALETCEDCENCVNCVNCDSAHCARRSTTSRSDCDSATSADSCPATCARGAATDACGPAGAPADAAAAAVGLAVLVVAVAVTRWVRSRPISSGSSPVADGSPIARSPAYDAMLKRKTSTTTSVLSRINRGRHLCGKTTKRYRGGMFNSRV